MEKKIEAVRAGAIKGTWWDEVYKKSGDGEVLVRKTPVKHNLIVEPFTKVIAGLLAGRVDWYGVQFHAIGEGDAAWDLSGPPAASITDTELVTEMHRKVPDSILPVKYGAGHAQLGTASAIFDPLREESGVVVGRFEPDDFFNGMMVTIIAGTNVGESRVVADYTQVTGEITTVTPFPVAIDDTSYYEFAPVASVALTNTLEVRTTWDYGIPTDPWNNIYIREQGLFGGDATILAGSGQMLDVIRHARIWKDDSLKLVRNIRLTIRP